jgi:hypothetical protein
MNFLDKEFKDAFGFHCLNIIHERVEGEKFSEKMQKSVEPWIGEIFQRFEDKEELKEIAKLIDQTDQKKNPEGEPKSKDSELDDFSPSSEVPVIIGLFNFEIFNFVRNSLNFLNFLSNLIFFVF